MRLVIAALFVASMAAGCGPRVGAVATLASKPVVDSKRIVDSTLVSLTETHRQEFHDHADDTQWLTEHLSDSILVDNGTSVRVIEFAKDGRQAAIRILDGPHKGKTGWVDKRDLK